MLATDLKNACFKLSNSVVKYYEENLDNGTLFLFDAKNRQTWTGNLAVYITLSFLDGQTPTQELPALLQSYFSGVSRTSLEENIYSVLSELHEKGYIKKV